MDPMSLKGSRSRPIKVTIAEWRLVNFSFRNHLRFALQQEFQVPKMEGFLNLLFGYFGVGGKTPYINRIHTAYIRFSYLHFRYLNRPIILLGFQ